MNISSLLTDQKIDKKYFERNFLSNESDHFEDKNNYLHVFYDRKFKLEINYSKSQNQFTYVSIEPQNNTAIEDYTIEINDDVDLFYKSPEEIKSNLKEKFGITLAKEDEWNYCFKSLCFVFSDNILESIFLRFSW